MEWCRMQLHETKKVIVGILVFIIVGGLLCLSQFIYASSFGRIESVAMNEMDLLVFFLSFASALILSTVSTFLIKSINGLAVNSVRNFSFNKFTHATLFEIESENAGSIGATFSQIIPRVANYYIDNNLKLIRLMMFIGMVFCVVINYSVLVAVLFILMLTIAVYFQDVSGKRLVIMRSNVVGAIKNAAGLSYTFLSNQRLLQSENSISWAMGKYHTEISKLEKTYRKNSFSMNFLVLCADFLSFLPISIIIVLPGLLFLLDKLDQGSCVFIITLGVTLSKDVIQLPQLLANRKEYQGDLKRIKDIWNMEEFINSAEVSYDNQAIAIETKNLSFAYGDKEIVTDISGRFGYGEICFICGANGSGKSTLLELLAGIREANEGKVIIHAGADEKNTQLVAVDWQIPYVFDSTIMDYIAPDMEKRKKFDLLLQDEVWRNRFEEVLGESFGLTNRANELSGGQKKCLSIVRTIVNPAKIKFFDEPTANVDIMTKEFIIWAINRCAKDEGGCIIIVSHDQELMNAVFDVGVNKLLLGEGHEKVASI